MCYLFFPRLYPQLEKREENNLAANPSGFSPVVTFLVLVYMGVMWFACVCTHCPSEVTDCFHLCGKKSSTLHSTWKTLYWPCSYCAPSFKNIPLYTSAPSPVRPSARHLHVCVHALCVCWVESCFGSAVALSNDNLKVIATVTYIVEENKSGVLDVCQNSMFLSPSWHVFNMFR